MTRSLIPDMPQVDSSGGEDPELRRRLQAQATAVLRTVSARRQEMDESELLLIRNARNEGVTWKQIAEALGKESPQAAQKRYQTLGGRAEPVLPVPCQVCGGPCGIVCDREAQQRADAEFDARVAASISRLSVRADQAGYVHAAVRVHAPEPPQRPRQLRITGLAGRAERFGPDVIVPETVPLVLEFSNTGVLSTATLTRDHEGIHALAVISLEDGTRPAMMHQRYGLWNLYPYLALSVAYASASPDGAMITAGRVASVSLCANGDDDVLRWKAVTG